jgi:hypothetical protein
MTQESSQEVSQSNSSAAADERVVPLSRIINFIRQRDGDAEASLVELDKKTPDAFTPLAEVTEYAGKLGRIAGARAALAALALEFVVPQSDESEVPLPRDGNATPQSA